MSAQLFLYYFVHTDQILLSPWKPAKIALYYTEWEEENPPAYIGKL